MSSYLMSSFLPSSFSDDKFFPSNLSSRKINVSNERPISTTELLKKIAKAFNKKALLFPVPVSWMIFVAKLLGKEADAVRLFSSLIIDNSKARDLLGWHPITTIDKQLKKL